VSPGLIMSASSSFVDTGEGRRTGVENRRPGGRSSLAEEGDLQLVRAEEKRV
jgi:hypothetical protein